MSVPHGTPQREHKRCNCKNSKCLKLYCECFAAGKYCDGCNCFNCKNNAAFATERREAVEATLERNPNAFRPKIAVVASPGGVGHAGGGVDGDGGDVVARHNRGCHCKRSGCLKKYCECFQAAIFCHETCKCVDCKNHEGSDAYATVKRVHGPDARFHDHASTAMSPSPGRRRALGVGGDGGALPGVAAGRALGASPRRNARESAGTSATDAATVPLMHNLVQQGAVEELARILLAVADETKASSTTNGADEEEKDATLATTTSDGLDVCAGRSSSPSAGGVATVAELAAAAVSPPNADVKAEPAADVEGLMCDETVSALGLAPKTSPSIETPYKEQERALLGEFERVISRLTQNAKARVEHARKTKSLVSAGIAAKKSRVK